MRIALIVFLLLTTNAFAQEREWQLDAVDEDVFLAFGVPETDDVGISFWCKINSGQLRIFVPEGSEKLQPDQNTTVAFSVAGADYQLLGQTSENQSTGRTSVEFAIPLTHPAIAALSKADHFLVVIADHKTATPLIDADVPGLLKLCAPGTGL